MTDIHQAITQGLADELRPPVGYIILRTQDRLLVLRDRQNLDYHTPIWLVAQEDGVVIHGVRPSILVPYEDPQFVDIIQNTIDLLPYRPTL